MTLLTRARHSLEASGRSLREFLSDLGSVLGPGALRQLALRVRSNDLLGLAGQLAYFFLLSFFPFLIFLVALAGLVLNEPESAVAGLIERTAGFLPEEAVGLLSDYTERTLQSTSPTVLFFGVVATLWLGSASAIAISKAANRAYGVVESRSFVKLRGTSILLAVGFTLLIAALTLVVFKVGAYLQGAGGPPGEETFLAFWAILRWALALLTVTFALSILYYLAPNADLPFRWVTPGGLVAAVLMFAASAALSFYVSRLGSYDQIYGQLGAVVVFMIWLYTVGLTVLVGVEVNAVLALRAERRKGVELIRPEPEEDRE